MRHTHETEAQKLDRQMRTAAARAGRPLPAADPHVNPLVASPVAGRRQSGATVQMSVETQETAHRAIQHLEVVRTHLHSLGENQMRDQADDMIDSLSAKYGRPSAESTEGTQNNAGDRLAARARATAERRSVRW